jgi:hypothetical protein
MVEYGKYWRQKKIIDAIKRNSNINKKISRGEKEVGLASISPKS